VSTCALQPYSISYALFSPPLLLLLLLLSPGKQASTARQAPKKPPC
jgi:hypothetical protein